MFVHVAVQRIPDRDVREAVERALLAVLPFAPRQRPVTVFAEAEATEATSACLGVLAQVGLATTRITDDTVALRPGPGAPVLRVPAAWVGSTLLMVTRLGVPPAPTTRALASLAMGAGFVSAGDQAARFGARLANDIFAAHLVVIDATRLAHPGHTVHVPRRVLAAALPRDARSAPAVDAWLARRMGMGSAGPPGIHVRTLGQGRTWGWHGTRGLDARRRLADHRVSPPRTGSA